MATATQEEFYDDYFAEDIGRAQSELNLLSNQAEEPEVAEFTEEDWRNLEGAGGLAAAARGVERYAPARREVSFMERRDVLGRTAISRELPPNVYGTSTPYVGPENWQG